jgi:hypothetical protein
MHLESFFEKFGLAKFFQILWGGMLDAFPRSAGDHLAQNFSRKI